MPKLIVVRSSDEPATDATIASLKLKWPDTPILALLCPGSDESFTTLSKLITQADDFLTCPYPTDELVLRAARLLNVSIGSEEVPQPSAHKLHFSTMVGESPAFLAALKDIPKLAAVEAPVVLVGETGTGKELFARALHYTGPRRDKPFVAVNCGGIPDLLFENELFGHSKGAFTNASANQRGLIAEAEGGTLFLDEVDTLSSGSQTKLLRFLQTGEYRALGSSRAQVGNVRVIAATNADLNAKIVAKEFRADLFYRLNSFVLHVPALRARAGDIRLLAEHFLARYARQYGLGEIRFTVAAFEKLAAYTWPGNVRELEAVVQRAIVLSAKRVIDADDLDIKVSENCERSNPTDLREAMTMALTKFEKTYITDLLSEHRGNLSQIARQSGKHRRTIQRLLRKHGLDRRSFN